MSIRRISMSTLTACIFAASLSFAAPDGIVRGIYCRPGPALDSRLWRGYGEGYARDDEVVRSGARSIRCTNDNDEQAQGAWQAVELNQREPRPLIVGGWARLENVSGQPSYTCSVYVDLKLQNGKSWPMKIAAFDPEKTGWQYAEETYTPPAPIRSARVYAFLRQRTGTAWFDDLYIGEVVDEAGNRSDNRLQQPGFERVDAEVTAHRDAFFDTLRSMNCNACHFYDGVSWDVVAGAVDAPLPALSAEDPTPGFVAAAHERGVGVWLTVGLGWPKLSSVAEENDRVYACVNNRWGNAYTRAVAHLAQTGVDGIGVVPDEWTFTTGRLKRAYAGHRDSSVADFVRSLPGYACCPVCEKRFQRQFGKKVPDLSKAWASAEPVWAQFLSFRYQETARWIQNTVQAAKAVNPDVVTDTMICVLPVCSDNRIGAGAAWDLIGAETELDCLQTDPYTLLHNYLGDSTHYYATETAIHLTAANWRGRSGVTLEASRLRENNRRKDPAEVYGAALSCLAHGAREFFWWHMTHVTGKTAFVDAEPARRRLAAAYDVMREMEPYLIDARPPGRILVLHSRRSEDVQHWLSKTGETTISDPLQEAQALGDNKVRDDKSVSGNRQIAMRKGFRAHRNVVYWLLRRGYAFRTTFLEHPDPAALEEADTVLVPFALALTPEETGTVRSLAEQGKSVVLMSCLAPRNRWGQSLPSPQLASLFGTDEQPALSASLPLEAEVGKGRAIFLGPDFALGLFDPVQPQKDRARRVPLAPFAPDNTAVLEALLGAGRTVFTEQPDTDVEAVVIQGGRGRVLLAINWDLEKDVELVLRPDVLGPGRLARGFGIDAEANVQPMSWKRQETPLRLAPQQAVLLRL